jgi:hypothetical protein
MTYRVLLGLDLLAAAILLYFFFLGLADGSVSDFNIEIWVALLLATAIVFGSALLLRRAAWPRLANVVLAVPAVPLLLYGIFMLVVVLSGESWN